MAADPKKVNSVDIPAHDIIVASSKDERQQCFDVRVGVFHHEQGFPLDLELDDKEDISVHILLRLTPSLKPIGTVRGYVVPGTTDTYKLTRLAILKEYRKYGFGRELVEALHTWVKAHSGGATPLTPVPVTTQPNGDKETNGNNTNFNPVSTTTNFNNNDRIDTPLLPSHRGSRWIKIHCHSQIYAKGFYSKFGYTQEGEEFIEDGDPHQKMVLRISVPISTPTIPNPA